MKSNEPLEKRWQNLLINDSTSLPGYLNQKRRKPFIQYNTILNYFGRESRKSSHEYRKFMAYGMENEIPNPLENGKGTGIIGKEDFIDEIKQLFKKDKRDKQSTREQPVLRELDKGILPEELINQYAKLVQKNREELTTKGKHSPERAMLMEFLYRFCKITQSEIGELLGGIDYSAVSLARKRMQFKIQNEPEWGKKFSQIRNKLGQM
jgi:hypothetical protein